MKPCPPSRRSKRRALNRNMTTSQRINLGSGRRGHVSHWLSQHRGAGNLFTGHRAAHQRGRLRRQEGAGWRLLRRFGSTRRCRGNQRGAIRGGSSSVQVSALPNARCPGDRLCHRSPGRFSRRARNASRRLGDGRAFYIRRRRGKGRLKRRSGRRSRNGRTRIYARRGTASPSLRSESRDLCGGAGRLECVLRAG